MTNRKKNIMTRKEKYEKIKEKLEDISNREMLNRVQEDATKDKEFGVDFHKKRLDVYMENLTDDKTLVSVMESDFDISVKYFEKIFDIRF